MKRLVDKTRVVAPDSDYPFGRIKDTTPTDRGTPANVEVYGDLHQFLEKMFDDSGVTANGLPDNEDNGFQLYRALIDVINKRASADLFRASLPSYATGDIIIMHGCVVGGAVGPGTATLSAGAVFYNDKIYKVQDDASIVTTGVQTLLWKIVPNSAVDEMTLVAGTSGDELGDYDDTTKVKYKKQTVIVPLPNWNMNSTGSISVAHGLTAFQWGKIKGVCVMVINNAKTQKFPLDSVNNVGVPNGGVVKIDTTNVDLLRALTLDFDDAAFGVTSDSRGDITIEYGDI